MIKIFWLIVYYGFAKHLPKSTVPIVGAMAKALRRSCAKYLFAQCGSDFNLEQGAYVGNGEKFSVGNNVGLGKDFTCHCRIVTIEDNLMMGESVLFLGGGHKHDDLSIPMIQQGGCQIRLCILVAMYGLALEQLSYLAANASVRIASSVLGQW